MTDNYPLLTVPGVDGIWHIYARSPGFGGDAWCHLVPGIERALLIDTGFGIGDLKGLAESLTDLPITLVNTHNHGDHTGGNAQFGKVYIHSLDAEGLKRQMEMPSRPLPPFEEREYKYTDADVVTNQPYEVETIEDGYVFDLGGGYEVEVFHIPGHSAGGIVLLDRKRRVLYSGDAIVWTATFCQGLFPGMKLIPELTIEKFREGLGRLMEHIDEFDVLYPGHSRLGLPNQYVRDMVACCDELLAGNTSVDEYVLGTDTPVHVHGGAKIAFCEERIRYTPAE